MDQKLSFLTKELVDNAVLEIDKNGIPKSREGSTYAILISNKEYPFKLLVTEAAKLAGVRLSSNDFGSSDSNRKGFENISGYQVIVKENKQSELVKFKNLLEYFVAHLEYTANQNIIGRGYERYIKPLVDSGNFKTSGQGWNGAAIQQQVQTWDTYPDGKICINIQSNYGSYASVKCYLNWQHTGINILASWNNSEIVGLYQDEFIYWEKPTRRTNTGKVYTIEMLKLFEGEIITEHLEDFFHSFISKYEMLKKKEIIKEQMKTVNKFKEILEHKKQIILQGPPGTGKTRQAKLIAKEMLGLESVDEVAAQEQFKLIQFHPSFTYEDFVRGIVAKPTKNGNGILYEAENKALGRFAQDALKNYNASKNNSVDSNIDNWIDDKFEVFKTEIEAKLPEEETILSGDISIFEVTSNYFKYAKNWNTSGYIKFGEFKKLVKAVVKGELELSTKQLDKERFIHAHYRYTYYNSLLKHFSNSIIIRMKRIRLKKRNMS